MFAGVEEEWRDSVKIVNNIWSNYKSYIKRIRFKSEEWEPDVEVWRRRVQARNNARRILFIFSSELNFHGCQ
jgi:hypothetical protein